MTHHKRNLKRQTQLVDQVRPFVGHHSDIFDNYFRQFALRTHLVDLELAEECVETMDLKECEDKTSYITLLSHAGLVIGIVECMSLVIVCTK